MSSRAIFSILQNCRGLASRSGTILPLHAGSTLSFPNPGACTAIANVCVRHQSQALPKETEDPFPPPQPSGAAKQHTSKITTLVNEISQLTLAEVADLTELLKKTLKIPDQAFMSAAPAAAAAAPQAGDEEAATLKKKEKSAFTIRLTKFDDTKKVQLIKEIKSLVEGMNLVQAKKYVESLPQVVRGDIPKDEAEKLKAQLEAAGGTVEMD
ncbi:hypothetical protein RvY_17706 [Ramazzottius varieornatus]|uniref:Ribosomal protein L7/L12 C-terminal domain-containing protein n=1 Tax=Ramazzottius varieornatus TaxID=947166 RepID=A0A1D1W320_RAMVA|nr:hypothetical protein RvY_17706 [Ramazzottius varieornatus]